MSAFLFALQLAAVAGGTVAGGAPALAFNMSGSVCSCSTLTFMHMSKQAHTHTHAQRDML